MRTRTYLVDDLPQNCSSAKENLREGFMTWDLSDTFSDILPRLIKANES
jgi:hypothetical protein